MRGDEGAASPFAPTGFPRVEDLPLCLPSPVTIIINLVTSTHAPAVTSELIWDPGNSINSQLL